jgi:DNA-binding transcriptional ArsR family regulator
MSALGDPTRRQILELLARAPSSVVDIARQLPVSRPAVSQHLKVLKEAGLVVHRAEGARHFYQADPEGLAVLRKYLESLWESALEQFKREAERSNQTRRTAKRTRR